MKSKTLRLVNTEIQPGMTADMTGIDSLAGTGKEVFFNLSMNDKGTDILKPGLGLLAPSATDYKPIDNPTGGELTMPDISTMGIPWQQAFMFIQAQILGELPKDGNGNIIIANVTPQQWKSLANRIIRYKICGKYTHSLSEQYLGIAQLFSQTDPEAYRTFHQWAGTYAKAQGAEFYGDYAGNINLTSKGGFASQTIRNLVRQSIQNPAQCVTNVRQGGLLNNRNIPYFEPDAPALSDGVTRLAMPNYCECIFNAYIDMGATTGDPIATLLEFMADADLCRIAMNQMGFPNTKLAAFGWTSNIQNSLDGDNKGYSVRTERNVPGGGVFSSFNFPNGAYKTFVGNILAMIIKTNCVFIWGDEKKYGYNPAFIADLVNGNTFSGSNPQIRPVSTSNFSGTGERAYAIQNLFFDRAVKDAIHLYMEMYNWSGGNFVPCAVKENSEVTWSVTTLDNHVDGYERRDAVAYKSQTGNRVSVFTLPTSYTKKTINHKIDGSNILNLDCVPIRPYVTLIDLNA